MSTKHTPELRSYALSAAAAYVAERSGFVDGSTAHTLAVCDYALEHFGCGERCECCQALALVQAARLNEARLLPALEAVLAALWHDAPDQCWATGPHTGDAVLDFAACPGCVGIAEATKAIAQMKAVTHG